MTLKYTELQYFLSSYLVSSWLKWSPFTVITSSYLTLHTSEVHSGMCRYISYSHSAYINFISRTSGFLYPVFCTSIWRKCRHFYRNNLGFQFSAT